LPLFFDPAGSLKNPMFTGDSLLGRAGLTPPARIHPEFFARR
jgi:hypothetical protein